MDELVQAAELEPEPPPDEPLLELEGLEVHFPIRRGIVDSHRRPAPGSSCAPSTAST